MKKAKAFYNILLLSYRLKRLGHSWKTVKGFFIYAMACAGLIKTKK